VFTLTSDNFDYIIIKKVF